MNVLIVVCMFVSFSFLQLTHSLTDCLFSYYNAHFVWSASQALVSPSTTTISYVMRLMFSVQFRMFLTSTFPLYNAERYLVYVLYYVTTSSFITTDKYVRMFSHFSDITAASNLHKLTSCIFQQSCNFVASHSWWGNADKCAYLIYLTKCRMNSDHRIRLNLAFIVRIMNKELSSNLKINWWE